MVIVSVINGRSMIPFFKDGDSVELDVSRKVRKDVKRNDIILIKARDGKKRKRIIKRVVGIPGDTLLSKDGKLYINGVKETTKTFGKTDGINALIPPNYVYVLGDNRRDSADSRSFGLVPYKKIIGKYIRKVNIRSSKSKSGKYNRPELEDVKKYAEELLTKWYYKNA